MARLPDLPVEVLDLIFERLKPKDLSRLVRLNRSLRAVCERFIYRRIGWQWKTFSTHKVRLRHLLRTLLARPELMDYINYATFLGPKTASLWTDGQSDLSPQELKALAGFAVGVNPTTQDQWLRAVSDGQLDAFIALLIWCLRNLKTLRIDLATTPGSNHKFYWSAFQKSAETSPLVDNEYGSKGLEYLLVRAAKESELEVEHYYIDGSENLFSVLALPKLQSLRLEMVVAKTLTWPTPPLATHTLKTLYLKGMLGDVLGELLPLVPSLEHLEYHFACNVSRDESKYLKCLEIKAALQHVKSTLKTLVISVDFFSHQAIDIGNGGDWGPEDSFGSLTEFTVLEILELPPFVLLGWDSQAASALSGALPKQLQTLRFRNDMWGCLDDRGLYSWRFEECMEVLRGYIKDTKHDSKRLERFDWFSTKRAWIASRAKKLRTICESAGISYGVELTKF